MTVFVDNIQGVWCHLMSDESPAELHSFASSIGLRREWYQGDHYDLTYRKRVLAVRTGAQPITRREMVTIRRRLRKNRNTK